MSETAATDSLTLTKSHRPLRWLWQVPILLAGILAILIVVLTRLPWQAWQPTGLERDLSEARQLLEQPDWEFQQIVQLTGACLELGETNPALAAQANYLLGSAYLLQADRPGSGSASVNLQRARSLLERAEQLGLTGADSTKLTFRLGKILFRQEEDPKRILEYLLPSIGEGADDPYDGYFMLAQTYLRFPEKEQDLHAALAANAKLLELPQDKDYVLAPARLQRGDILLRLHKPVEAREALEKVGNQAPSEVLAQARYLLAWSHQQESHWNKALALWQEALTDSKSPVQHKELVLYNLGICQRQLDDYRGAGHSWEQCILASPRGESAVAASFLLGDLRLLKLAKDDKGQAKKAVESYAFALGEVANAETWNNSLLSLARCRESLDTACLILRNTGEYELSITLAGHYEKIALNGRALELRAEAAHYWALALEDLAHGQSKPEDALELEKEAVLQFRMAGESYGKAAEITSRPEEIANRLWNSSLNFTEAKDPSKTVEMLKRFVKQCKESQRLGEAFYQLAEAYQTLKQIKDAENAFRACIQYPGRFAYRARFQLAHLAIEGNDLDGAKAQLEQNLQLLQSDEDPEALEKTLYMLGNLLVDAEDYRIALFRLEAALKKFPKSAEALTSKQKVAECYQRLGEEEIRKLKESRDPTSEKSHTESAEKNLNMAITKYREIEMQLRERKSKGKLKEEEQTILMLSSFAEAACYRSIGKPAKARELYQALANEYNGQLEGVRALSWIFGCYLDQGKKKDARQVLDKISEMLKNMPDSAFTTTVDSSSRKEFMLWVEGRKSEIDNPK
jgi:TolA-binding protein